MLQKFSSKIQKLFLVAILMLGLSSPQAGAIDFDLQDDIDGFLDTVYKAWNEHDSEKLFSFYSSSFITSDGLDKDQFQELTEKLWKNYPDIKLESQTRSIRSQDSYATVSIVDLFYGTSDDEHKDLGDSGRLSAISQGQIFLKKYGREWRIESDRANFELVTISFGNVKQYLDQNLIYFAAPEQVNSGDEYSGTLYFILPENIQATATINKELITSPSDEIDESFQAITTHKLERLFSANSTNHNELISATVVLTKGILEPTLEGILFISKRINVIPSRGKIKKQQIAKYSFADPKRLEPEESDKESKSKAEEVEELILNLDLTKDKEEQESK